MPSTRRAPRFHTPAVLLGALALAGCAGSVPPPGSGAPAGGAATVAPTRVNPMPAPVFRRAARMNLPGLEGVVGATAPGLLRRFGEARLDILEGDARKLQFAGNGCVLDVYLYPPAPRAEPEADYVDARLPDGRDTDRAGCVAALTRR
jgi:hypothetical protein